MISTQFYEYFFVIFSNRCVFLSPSLQSGTFLFFFFVLSFFKYTYHDLSPPYQNICGFELPTYYYLSSLCVEVVFYSNLYCGTW